MRLLSHTELSQLLQELGAELERRGVYGELFIVGGAAMALAYSRDRLTRDLDGVFEPKNVVLAAAEAIGEKHDLAKEWLNDAVKGFLPGEDPNATVLFESDGISVRVASPRYLFAMKAAAARVDRDANDLRRLYQMCGFSSVEEALECVEGYYPPHLLQPKTSFLLRELLNE